MEIYAGPITLFMAITLAVIALTIGYKHGYEAAKERYSKKD